MIFPRSARCSRCGSTDLQPSTASELMYTFRDALEGTAPIVIDGKEIVTCIGCGIVYMATIDLHQIAQQQCPEMVPWIEANYRNSQFAALVC